MKYTERKKITKRERKMLMDQAGILAYVRGAILSLHEL
jgi:hypothetical protein